MLADVQPEPGSSGPDEEEVIGPRGSGVVVISRKRSVVMHREEDIVEQDTERGMIAEAVVVCLIHDLFVSD